MTGLACSCYMSAKQLSLITQELQSMYQMVLVEKGRISMYLLEQDSVTVVHLVWLLRREKAYLLLN